MMSLVLLMSHAVLLSRCCHEQALVLCCCEKPSVFCIVPLPICLLVKHVCLFSGTYQVLEHFLMSDGPLSNIQWLHSEL